MKRGTVGNFAKMAQNMSKKVKVGPSVKNVKATGKRQGGPKAPVSALKGPDKGGLA